MNKITLRGYQKKAIEKIFWARENNFEGNDLIVLPTGSGKSLVISNLIKSSEEHVLIIQPTKEILEQNVEKLLNYIDRSDIGIYSESMKEKTIRKFTFATIQSIYKKAEEFEHFNFVIIDEAHLVNPNKKSSMFNKFLAGIKNPKVIGFTATPYRLEQQFRRRRGGFIDVKTFIQIISRMTGFFWHRILYKVDLQELIEKKYLCPINYIDKSLIEIDEAKSEAELVKKCEKVISSKIKEVLGIIEYAKGISKSIAVFCSSIKQAEELSELVQDSAVVSSYTKKIERETILNGFKSGKIKVIFNVGVLSIGFDFPALDCIVLLRPTKSIALYYQMIGRGVRTSVGKKQCNVIDMTSTIKTLGKVESIKLEKIEGKWELLTDTGSWHNRQLYQNIFRLKGK